MSSIKLEVRYEGVVYRLSIRKTVFKGVEMCYKSKDDNWLLSTWRNGSTIDEVAEKWEVLFKQNNIEEWQ